MSHNITIEGGTSLRLKTAGKYCDRDIVVTSSGGTENLEAVLNEQEALIAELKETLNGKATGGGEPIIEPLEVTENGEYTPPDGVDGYAPVVVNVPTGGGGTGNSAVDLLAGTAKEVIDTSGAVKSLNQYAFYENDGIETVRLPAVTSVGSYNFRSCSNLITIDLPEMTGSTGTYFATSASKLVNVNIPKAPALGQYSMRYCAKLEYLDLPMVTSIANYSLAGCSNLNTLILRSSAGVVTNSGTATLSGTAIANGDGYVYVPRTLDDGTDGVEAYKSATNWTKFANQFRAKEDYPEITGG